MAVYKVPQDVEAEDKLIGPFGFRQFIYLLIAGGAGGLTFLFFQVPPPVPFFSVLTIPVILVFVVLALPLRKDQPMEIYIAAVLRFMFKPKKRLWMNDGTAAGVIIDAPRVIAQHLSKEITQEEALDRLAYLSRIVDTRGWAAKGVDTAVGGTLARTDTTDPFGNIDVLDEGSKLAQSFDSMLAKQRQETAGNISQILHPPSPQKPPESAATQKPAEKKPAVPAKEEPKDKPNPQNEALERNPWARFDSRQEYEEPAPHPRGSRQHGQSSAASDLLRTHTFHASEVKAMKHEEEARPTPIAASNPAPTTEMQPAAVPIAEQAPQPSPTTESAPAITPIKAVPQSTAAQPVSIPLASKQSDAQQTPIASPEHTPPSEIVAPTTGPVPATPPINALPAAELTPKTPQPTPPKDVTPQIAADKIRLAYNNDLSIQTIANEAHRIDDAAKEVEVEIKLR